MLKNGKANGIPGRASRSERGPCNGASQCRRKTGPNSKDSKKTWDVSRGARWGLADRNTGSGGSWLTNLGFLLKVGDTAETNKGVQKSRLH